MEPIDDHIKLEFSMLRNEKITQNHFYLKCEEKKCKIRVGKKAHITIHKTGFAHFSATGFCILRV